MLEKEISHLEKNCLLTDALREKPELDAESEISEVDSYGSEVFEEPKKNAV